MNKSAIVARVARRMGLNKFAAEGAVDTVLEAIAESLGWRKTPLFDRFLSFDVRLARDCGAPH